jgi:hypothetical protein
VFTTETDGKVDPRNFLGVIEKAAATAKVEGVGVHTLRHSAATVWLESGIHIKQVADLLGHYSTSITGDILRARLRRWSAAGHREARRAARTLGMSHSSNGYVGAANVPKSVPIGHENGPRKSLREPLPLCSGDNL